MSNILPSIAAIVSASSAIKTLIGSNPIRFYPMGAAPQGTAAPYVTERAIDIVPEVTLSELPLVDASRVQLSCWSDDAAGARAVATALRDAIEPVHDIVTMRDMGRDFETQRFRIDLDVAVWHHRGTDESSSSSSSGP